jgi:hypothetical protein
MQVRSYKVYRFKELSKEAKEKAIEKWYEKEDYPFLKEDLKESCKALLEQHKIKYDNLDILYSLSYCQGDGFCFTGNFIYKKKHYKITHSYNYYYPESVSIDEIINEEENGLNFQDDKDNPFIKLYLKIARELEKEGYGILEYRMSEIEFNEHCEVNDYYFTKDGDIDH